MNIRDISLFAKALSAKGYIVIFEVRDYIAKKRLSNGDRKSAENALLK
jgi:hypothetical protein